MAAADTYSHSLLAARRTDKGTNKAVEHTRVYTYPYSKKWAPLVSAISPVNYAEQITSSHSHHVVLNNTAARYGTHGACLAVACYTVPDTVHMVPAWQ